MTWAFISDVTEIALRTTKKNRYIPYATQTKFAVSSKAFRPGVSGVKRGRPRGIFKMAGSYGVSQ